MAEATPPLISDDEKTLTDLLRAGPEEKGRPVALRGLQLDNQWSAHGRRVCGIRVSDIEMFVVILLAVAAVIVPLSVLSLWEGQFLDAVSSHEDLRHALVPLIQLIPELLSLHLAANYVTHGVGAWFTLGLTESSVSARGMHCKRPSRTVGVLMIALILKECKISASYALKGFTADVVESGLNMLIAFLSMLAAEFALDALHDAVWKYARVSIEVLSIPAVVKSRSIVCGFASFKNAEKDKAYSFGEHGSHISPTGVMAEIVTIFILIGKGIVLVMYFLFLIGVDLYANIIPLIVISGSLSAVSAMQLGDSFSALFALAVSKPFYVGEIVGLSCPGAAPADAPKNNTVGMVEAITWFHVVLRDFKKKQIFLPHKEFAKLTVHNWTRRPAHLCYWMLTTSCGEKDGTKLAALARFTRKWIAQHDLIDREGYTKAVVKGQFGTGLKMEVVFYPKVGKSVHQLRAEFVVSIMDAATRLGLTLIPEDIVTPYPEDMASADRKAASSSKGEASEGVLKSDPLDLELDDLLPSQADLSKRAGYA